MLDVLVGNEEVSSPEQLIGFVYLLPIADHVERVISFCALPAGWLGVSHKFGLLRLSPDLDSFIPGGDFIDDQKVVIVFISIEIALELKKESVIGFELHLGIVGVHNLIGNQVNSHENSLKQLFNLRVWFAFWVVNGIAYYQHKGERVAQGIVGVGIHHFPSFVVFGNIRT